MSQTNPPTDHVTHTPIRLGLLAASKIATSAVLAPVAEVDGVEVTAVAARDLDRARATAEEFSIATAYGSYDELIADPDIDAIYVATPASLHRRWTIAALEAGKHVLVEKPLASNAADANAIRAVADAHPELVCFEAFHWRYHPMNQRWIDIVRSGRIGSVTQVTARFNLPIDAIPAGNIRWELALGGGATMDLGCYSIQFVRAAVEPDGLTLGGAGVVPDVTAAVAAVPVEQVDGRLTAALRWPDGATGMIESSMVESAAEPTIDVRIIGTDGEITMWNPLHPSGGGSGEGNITVIDGAGREVIAVDDIPGGRLTTYYYQLAAFRDAINAGVGFPTTMASGVTNMEIIDACYRAAGLMPRPTAD